MRPSLVRAVASVAALSLTATGCLSSSYSLRREELQRLARTAPEARWQAVRTTQRLLASDAPPSTQVALPTTQTVTVLPSVYWYAGSAYSVPSLWRNNPVGWASRASLRGGGGGTSGRSGSSSSSSSSGSSSGGSGSSAGAVVAAVVGAAFVVFILAGSEGARYDGWMGLPPDEMLYLDNPDGTVSSVPLSSLTPELADQSRGAAVYEGSTERYLRLARAPLDRVGFTVQSSAVFALIPRLGPGETGTVAGFGGRAFFGGFPAQQVGLGVSTDVVGGTDGSLVANVGGEVQVMPITWVGAYLGAGWSSFNTAVAAQGFTGWYARAGVQAELPFTTRLTGSLRAGATRVEGGGALPAAWIPELALGLAIY